MFDALSATEIEALQPIARQLVFAAGQEVFKEGDAGDGLYVVAEGRVEISVPVNPQTRLVFSQIEPGDLFGEMAVLEDKPRSATAVAREPTTLYFLPRDEMLKRVNHSPALALGLLREISHRLREFNHQYLREVLQAERLAVVGRFAGSIVHDLKNPLNIIGLTAEVSGMPNAKPELRQKAASDIRRQVDRITDLIGEILEFTRGPQTELLLTPMDYAVFIQEVIEEMRPETSLKNVSIEIEAPLPQIRVLINPKRLHRVFYNLIHNACDAMPKGGKVFVRARSTPSEVVTELEDTGPGIPPEVAGRLFQPFATHGKLHGTGLGLSICKRIVEDHRGWINARTAPGRGAVFCFGLPLPSEPAEMKR